MYPCQNLPRSQVLLWINSVGSFQNRPNMVSKDPWNLVLDLTEGLPCQVRSTCCSSSEGYPARPFSMDIACYLIYVGLDSLTDQSVPKSKMVFGLQFILSSIMGILIFIRDEATKIHKAKHLIGIHRLFWFPGFSGAFAFADCSSALHNVARCRDPGHSEVLARGKGP